MKALVAGCAGFIGFHLAERLLNEGHEVVGLDNLVTGQSRNVDDLRKHANFSFVQHDLTQPLPFDAPASSSGTGAGRYGTAADSSGTGAGRYGTAADSSGTGAGRYGRFEQVYNLACPASPKDFKSLQLEILAVCSQGVRNLLELCRAHGARLLHTSTSEVYGDPEEHPQKETYWGHVNPIGPRSCYDEGKRFAEALITAYANQHGVECRMVRIFNTYGPRMRPDDGRVLPNFIAQAFAGEPLTVYGDGSQTRSFCFVDDMVEGILRLAASDVREPVNIGNPVEITIRQFAEEIIALTSSRSSIRETPLPHDDPKRRKPDITRARERLGWEPRVERREGLARTIAWFRDHPCR